MYHIHSKRPKRMHLNRSTSNQKFQHQNHYKITKSLAQTQIRQRKQTKTTKTNAKRASDIAETVKNPRTNRFLREKCGFKDRKRKSNIKSRDRARSKRNQQMYGSRKCRRMIDWKSKDLSTMETIRFFDFPRERCDRLSLARARSLSLSLARSLALVWLQFCCCCRVRSVEGFWCKYMEF